MPLPYKIATLLYCFNERDEILLLERAQEPNRGLVESVRRQVEDGYSVNRLTPARAAKRTRKLAWNCAPPICIWPDSSANTAIRARRTG